MPESAQPNRPLSGTELKKIMLNDISRILDQDGMLASHIAYGRASYQVTYKVMTANPIIPEWKNGVKSKKSTEQQIQEDETLAAVEAHPLAGDRGDDALDSGFERTREIISPNQSRIENELPILINFRGPDGDMKEEPIKYDISALPEDGFPDSVQDRELEDAEIATE